MWLELFPGRVDLPLPASILSRATDVGPWVWVDAWELVATPIMFISEREEMHFWAHLHLTQRSISSSFVKFLSSVPTLPNCIINLMQMLATNPPSIVCTCT